LDVRRDQKVPARIFAIRQRCEAAARLLGPGLGPVVGPAANFASIAVPAKWLLALAMLLGRLELSTIYVMLLAEYWRR
jgi:Trk-type K+ transport system membrane component